MRRLLPLLLLFCAGCGTARLDTPHLRIRSGLDPASTQALAALLERTVEAYRGLYAPVWDLKGEPPPVDVVLLADPRDFDRELEKATGKAQSPGTQGRYLHGNRTLYVNAGNRGAESTAVHEFVHALDHVWAGLERPPHHPLWCYEGRCDDLGYAILADGRIAPGAARFTRDSVEKLEKALGDAVPLKELVGMRGRDYYLPEGVNRNYAQSWAFVHFLLHGDSGRHAEGFRRYLKGLPERFQAKHLEAEVGPLEGLEAAFRRHVGDVILAGAREAAR